MWTKARDWVVLAIAFGLASVLVWSILTLHRVATMMYTTEMARADRELFVKIIRCQNARIGLLEQTASDGK